MSFWKLLDGSYVKSSFLAITGHINSSILREA